VAVGDVFGARATRVGRNRATSLGMGSAVDDAVLPRALAESSEGSEKKRGFSLRPCDKADVHRSRTVNMICRGWGVRREAGVTVAMQLTGCAGGIGAASLAGDRQRQVNRKRRGVAEGNPSNVSSPADLGRLTWFGTVKFTAGRDERVRAPAAHQPDRRCSAESARGGRLAAMPDGAEEAGWNPWLGGRTTEGGSSRRLGGAVGASGGVGAPSPAVGMRMQVTILAIQPGREDP
jgi:hypothetical protein